MHETLSTYADDAEIEIVEFHGSKITISISIPSNSGETWLIHSDDVVHIDMCPVMTLGRIYFGDLTILPPAYSKSRNLDYGGEKEKYRVIHFVDVDGKNGYLVLYGNEIIKKQESG